MGNSGKGCGKARSDGGEALHPASPPRPGLRAYLAIMRPHQWSKNLLVFLPLFASHESSPALWLDGVWAFVCFSLVASSVYVLNDMLDLDADQDHPRKRHRSFASGAVPLSHGTMIAPALLLAGVAVGLLVWRMEFLLVVALYYVTTLAYSLGLKRKPILDICVLAVLYTLRIYAGGAATGLAISQWLLAFSVFFFFSLAAVKRLGELADGVRSGRETVAGRGYENDDYLMVAIMAVASGYVAVLVMAFYLDSPTVGLLYNHPGFLWGLCPVLLFWISRMALTAYRGRMDDDPIVFAVKDRVSRYCAMLVLLVIIAGTV